MNSRLEGERLGLNTYVIPWWRFRRFVLTRTQVRTWGDAAGPSPQGTGPDGQVPS